MMKKTKIKKIFIVLILLGFLFLNTQSEAKEKKTMPLGAMVFKDMPLLFVDMIKVTPSAFIPLLNLNVAQTNQVYNETKKRSKEEYVKYQEELLYGKKENEEETPKPLTLEDKPLSNPVIDEAKNLDSDTTKKIIFDSKNSSIESYDLISKGLKDGNYLKYSSLFDYSVAQQTLKNKKGKSYDFSDNYNTFLLLNQNGYSDEDIKKIINQTTTLKPFDDRYFGYKYKEKQTKLVMDNKKIDKDKKIDKLISKNKTNYEKIRQTPVLGAVEQTGETFVLVPAAVGAISVFLAGSLTLVPASIYAGMTKDWYNNLKTIRNCDLRLLELDKELELKEKNID